MTKLQTKIMSMDFKKTVKHFILLSLVIVLLGGILTGFLFRTQISEAVTWHQTYESNRGSEDVRYDGEHDYGDREREHEREYEGPDFFESGQFTQPTVVAVATFITYVSLCGLLALAYWLLIMAWLYQAASKADMNRTLWTILGLFFNLAAVIGFLIARSQQTVCPSCGVYQKSGAFCRVCGASLQMKCGECGTVVDGKAAYCPHCGKPLKDKTK